MLPRIQKRLEIKNVNIGKHGNLVTLGNREEIPMKCKKCGGNGSIRVTRNKENGGVYRRRRCSQCKNVWTTIELDADYMKRIVSIMTKITDDLRKK